MEAVLPANLPGRNCLGHFGFAALDLFRVPSVGFRFCTSLGVSIRSGSATSNRRDLEQRSRNQKGLANLRFAIFDLRVTGKGAAEQPVVLCATP